MARCAWSWASGQPISDRKSIRAADSGQAGGQFGERVLGGRHDDTRPAVRSRYLLTLVRIASRAAPPFVMSRGIVQTTSSRLASTSDVYQVVGSDQFLWGVLWAITCGDYRGGG